jgi:DNA-directed RNA polymerase subunit RPC12/RpoP
MLRVPAYNPGVPDAKPPREYLGPSCAKCGKPIPWQDLTGGKKIQIAPDAKVSMPCRHCGHRDMYGQKDFKVFRTAPKKR